MSAFDRRDFLRMAASVSLVAALPRAYAAEPGRKLLILVELKGGNDGLNTVIPYADPEYARLRPKLALDRDQVIKLTPAAALHPSLAGLEPAWQAKQLAIVQGVGYPEPNLSHFRSIEIWDTASKSDEYLEQGWLARAFARSPSPAGFAADGVAVGPGGLGPLSGGGARAISLSSPEQFLRNARFASDEGESKNAALAHILRVERDVVVSASRLRPGRGLATTFPQGAFGNATHVAAQLASNESGIAVVRVTLDGFDTHANQLPRQAALLRQLGEGLASLRNALVEIGRWDDTLVATYAEFGRRPRENQSGGTDHGTASVHFAMGGKVKGGLYGAAPELRRLDGSGNLPFAVDFRGYYATLLESWWEIPSAPVLGGKFPRIDFV